MLYSDEEGQCSDRGDHYERREIANRELFASISEILGGEEENSVRDITTDKLEEVPLNPFELKKTLLTWKIHVDGVMNSEKVGLRIILEAPSGIKIEEYIPIVDTCTNNEVEYKAFIYDLELALAMGIKRIQMHTDNMLVVH
ncbi:hypothetical protein F8388_017430 [Cannabis sativa]|uniref:RNase H type-1 domain-containing protein n=1 Tax=Cannabis sativa TaxID=3483 RepID=A0A7J6EFI0_CANSA|nr:hypothetical protein F8388_017430 [Cannabis sativa]